METIKILLSWLWVLSSPLLLGALTVLILPELAILYTLLWFFVHEHYVSDKKWFNLF